MWLILRAKKCGSHTGPSDARILRDEFAYLVLECMEQNFSDDDIVDIVLTSFGVTRSLLARWLFCIFGMTACGANAGGANIIAYAAAPYQAASLSIFDQMADDREPALLRLGLHH
jgi:hypothetical protein